MHPPIHLRHKQHLRDKHRTYTPPTLTPNSPGTSGPRQHKPVEAVSAVDWAIGSVVWGEMISVMTRSSTTNGRPGVPDTEVTVADDREGPADDDKWTRGTDPDVDVLMEKAATDAPPRERPRAACP